MKPSALATFLALSLPLAACGGGGDGENNNNPQQTTIESTAGLDGLMQYMSVDPTNQAAASSPPIVGDQVFVPSGLTPRLEGIWSFDISGLPSNAVITSAVLRLQITGIAGDPTAMMTLGRVDHVNYGATFPTLRSLISNLQAAFAEIADMNTLGERLVDVATQVQDDIDNSRPRSQFRVRGAVATNNDPQADFSVMTDAENANPAIRPQLILEFTTP